MKTLRFAFALATVLCAGLRAEIGNELLLDIPSTTANPRNSEGSSVTLRSGRIVFYYSQFAEGTSDYSPARIAEVHSDDRGRTWSVPRPFMEKSGGMNLMSVSLLRLASAKLAMFYAVKKSGIDCSPYLRLSADDGATWSEPKRVVAAPGYFVLNNDRVIQTRSGRLIVPVAFNRSLVAGRADSTDDQMTRYNDLRGIILWYLSDDEGATWRESSTWWAMPIPSKTGLQEPGVVELANGCLLSWARSDHGQFDFRSSDGGKTWTPPEPTELKTPAAPASIKRLPHSGDLIAVYNDYSGRFPHPSTHPTYRGRTPLVIAVSHDDGRTWPVRKLLEDDPKGEFCYTAIHFVDDAIFLAYTSGGGGRSWGALRIRRLTRSWLAAP